MTRKKSGKPSATNTTPGTGFEGDAITFAWNRKVSDYLSIFLILPILMAAALTFSSSFWSQLHVHKFLSSVLPVFFFTATRWLVSLGLLWFAFIFPPALKWTHERVQENMRRAS